MAKKFGFFNSINGDRKYLATDISQAFDVAVTTGLQAIPDSFKIVPNDGMTVKMLPGGCMIYGAFCVDNEDEIIELDVADGELNRIDRVVIRYDRFERCIKTAVIKGTPALNPTPPAPLRDENQFDLVLADIRVNKTVTSITASDITDMRYSELCGFIGVKGAVTEERFESHLADTVSDNVHGLKSVLDKKFDIGEYPQNSTYGYLSYSGDVDLLLRHGTYFVTAANVTNLPIEHNGWLKVMCQSGNYGLQEYIPQHGTGLVDTYRRFLNAGTWEAWQKI